MQALSQDACQMQSRRGMEQKAVYFLGSAEKRVNGMERRLVGATASAGILGSGLQSASEGFGFSFSRL